MRTATALHIGFESHPGLYRTINEDRVLIDEAHGLFLVADGLGGHAAGETAAEIAAQTIGEYLTRPGAAEDLEKQIKAGITEANNRIFDLAQTHEAWAGMACVLTLAVVGDGCATVGHVGDSRLYLVSNGLMQKVTSDHSPIGELEENGELAEKEAMQHPRRHEVFRDVGSERRQWDDSEFVQTKHIPFHSDAALLLCSDGLTDALTSAEINQIVDGYCGNSQEIASALINAANKSGGKDNVSVIFVAGPEFSPSKHVTSIPAAGDRHSITRMRVTQSRWAILWQKLPWLLTGMLLGILIWTSSERLAPHAAVSGRSPANARPPVHITANAANARSLMNALASALPGDVIDVPPGNYFGPIVLKDRVSVIGSLPHRPVIRSDPAASMNLGLALAASGIHDARLENLEVVGDGTNPLQIGISITDSDMDIVNCKISGAIDAGIRVEGKSKAALIADVVSENSGVGVIAKGPSFVRLTSNWITDNGKVPGMLRAGLETASTVQLEAGNNLFLRNGLSELNAPPFNGEAQLRENNFFELSARRKAGR